MAQARDQETMLRKKRSVGDWFLGFCVITLAVIGVVKTRDNHSWDKAMTVIEKMVDKKTTP